MRELKSAAEIIFQDFHILNSFKFPNLLSFLSHIQFLPSYFINLHHSSHPYSIINSLILHSPVDCNLVLMASTLLLVEGSRIIYWAPPVYLNLSNHFFFLL